MGWILGWWWGRSTKAGLPVKHLTQCFGGRCHYFWDGGGALTPFAHAVVVVFREEEANPVGNLSQGEGVS